MSARRFLLLVHRWLVETLGRDALDGLLHPEPPPDELAERRLAVMSMGGEVINA